MAIASFTGHVSGGDFDLFSFTPFSPEESFVDQAVGLLASWSSFLITTIIIIIISVRIIVIIIVYSMLQATSTQQSQLASWSAVNSLFSTPSFIFSFRWEIVIVYEDDRDEDENDEKDFEIDDLDRCRSMSVREQLLCIQTALSLYGGCTLTAFK